MLPPCSAEGGTTALPSFLFFAEDVSLINQRRASRKKQAPAQTKQSSKHLPVHRKVLHPSLVKLEARQHRDLRSRRSGSGGAMRCGGGTGSSPRRCWSGGGTTVHQR